MSCRGDTIAAVATAPGRGGVAIVRVSGPDSFAIAAALTDRRPEPGRIALVGIRASAASPSAARVRLDTGVMLAFAAPRSYTGEDVIEFQCHGGTVTPRRILDAVFAAGARLARRGEFTERAFLNGRLSLDAAEGVLDLVNARTDRAADAALARMAADSSRRHRALYDTALALSTEIEHLLDVDEDELPPGLPDELHRRAASLAAELNAALRRLRGGNLLRHGALVVLAGPPNAGKSSLMNALLGTDRAIVSDTPGTTRDSIEEWLDLDGWPVRLVDTAGLRDAADPVESQGVSRAESLIAAADLVLALDCDIPRALRLHAKCDLDPANAEPDPRSLSVSALTGVGLDSLRAAIVERLERLAAAADESPDDSDRAASLLQSALRALGSYPSAPPDLVLMANAVRSCAGSLGRLVGAVYSSDLLDALFSRFCVGK